jgi:hypothetical protein
MKHTNQASQEELGAKLGAKMGPKIRMNRRLVFIGILTVSAASSLTVNPFAYGMEKNTTPPAVGDRTKP